MGSRCYSILFFLHFLGSWSATSLIGIIFSSIVRSWDRNFDQSSDQSGKTEWINYYLIFAGKSVEPWFAFPIARIARAARNVRSRLPAQPSRWLWLNISSTRGRIRWMSFKRGMQRSLNPFSFVSVHFFTCESRLPWLACRELKGMKGYFFFFNLSGVIYQFAFFCYLEPSLVYDQDCYFLVLGQKAAWAWGCRRRKEACVYWLVFVELNR